MVKPAKKAIGVIGAGFLLVALKQWPILLEPDGIASLKLYAKYVLGERVKVSELLGPVHAVCGVGPAEDFNAYAPPLSARHIEAANAALREQRNKTRRGDIQTFLVGFREYDVVSIYASHVFVKQGYCVTGDGFIVFQKRGDSIALGLEGSAPYIMIE